MPVTAPSQAPAGVYGIKVNASATQASATVRVLAQRNVTVRAEDGDTLGLNGQVDASFLVRNDGNVPEVLTFSAQPSGLQVALPGTSLAPGEQRQVRVAGALPESGSPSRRITLTVRGQGGLAKSASVTRLLLKGAMSVEESSLTLKGQLKFSVWPQVMPELQLSGRIGNAVPGTVRFSLSPTNWSAGYQDSHLAFGIGHLAVSNLALQPGLNVFGVSAAVSRSQWWAKSSAGWQDGGFAGNVLLGYSGARVECGAGIQYLADVPKPPRRSSRPTPSRCAGQLDAAG